MAEQENLLEGYMTELESAQAVMRVIAEINKLITPMGAHIGREIRIMASSHTPAATISIGFRADVLKRYSAQSGMSTNTFFEKVKGISIAYAEVPPMAEYEIRWVSKGPENSEEKQVFDKVLKGCGPMLIAALTD
jgi:hypothetical protein